LRLVESKVRFQKSRWPVLTSGDGLLVQSVSEVCEMRHVLEDWRVEIVS
jgi:hypothetical protein